MTEMEEIVKSLFLKREGCEAIAYFSYLKWSHRRKLGHVLYHFRMQDIENWI